MRITQTIAKRLPETPQVLELDVTDSEHLGSLAERLTEHVDHLDGVLHSIGFAPQGAFNFMEGTWEDVSTALHASAYSLKSLSTAALPLLGEGGSIVGLTFDAKFAWPVYDWMGVAKAAFESTSRYLARDLGPKKVRCNLVAAGPSRQGVCSAALRLVSGHDRRDRARRRRRARHGPVVPGEARPVRRNR